MTQQTERLVPEAALQVANGAEWAPQAATQTPVLITEAEVVFSTAAAGALRPTTKGWRTQASRVAGIWRTLAAPLTYELPTPRPRPKRLLYIEDALMGREMGRL